VDVSVQTAAVMATPGQGAVCRLGDRPTKRTAGGGNFGGVPLRFLNPALGGYLSVTVLFGSAVGPFSRRLIEVTFEEGSRCEPIATPRIPVATRLVVL
jgi:hypothetical protein